MHHIIPTLFFSDAEKRKEKSFFCIFSLRQRKEEISFFSKKRGKNYNSFDKGIPFSI